MNEIIFNGKGSYTDFDTILNYFNPQPPAIKVVKAEVPFMNGSYDFSTVGTNGETVYTERKIPCSLQYYSSNKGLMLTKYSQLLEWLLNGKQELIYSAEPGLKYIARVEEAPSFEIFAATGGTLVFSFTADPFKSGIDLAGHEKWDTFCFDTDYLQDTEFDITTSGTITIYNPGRSISPTVNCSSSMTVLNNGYAANFVSGDNKDWAFKLIPGQNTIQVNGTGHIKFIFRKEVL